MHLSSTTIAAFFVATMVSSFRAKALGPNCVELSRSNLVPCALQASLHVQSERHSLLAAEARKTAAATVLPRNPELEVVAAHRRAPMGGEGLHWSAKLSQELELGGQRGLRRSQASAEAEAEKQRLLEIRRNAAAGAWSAYFGVARAQRDRELAERVHGITLRVERGTSAMSEAGVLSPIEADLSAMAGSRARQGLLAAIRETQVTRMELARLVGLDPASGPPRVSAELEPLSAVDAFARRLLNGGRTDLPEVRALEAEERALTARAELIRRSRVPNVTLSAFVERDKFEGQLVGGGLSIPLPLPAPLGRTLSGEVAESQALADRARIEAERVSREARGAVAQALAVYESRLAELQTLPRERASLAEVSLESLATEVKLGRLRVRDALVTQEQLVAFLRARLDAEYALCIASLVLAQAASFPLEGNEP